MKAADYWLTEIYDPVAGVALLLDEDEKVAHRMPVQPTSASAGQSAALPRGEAIGTRVFDGIAAEGTRLTSGPLTIETWTATELKIELAVSSSNGYAHRLINLTRSEPDPALFAPPAGWRVVDETGPFPMTIKTGNRAAR